ncbi:hypothetical protein GDO81_006776 [Engystomops pustulosus]|uniref:Uncharacterized protein n=1 Tax=Engystomops pustulosus TaxID=76066 RepID=A0AAV7CZ81_ENGPU|nr:hypothetical protein GDO81_006776 [Engystomops pustulosus]
MYLSEYWSTLYGGRTPYRVPLHPLKLLPLFGLYFLVLNQYKVNPPASSHWSSRHHLKVEITGCYNFLTQFEAFPFFADGEPL